jgi:hypothetical protein
MVEKKMEPKVTGFMKCLFILEKPEKDKPDDPVEQEKL